MPSTRCTCIWDDPTAFFVPDRVATLVVADPTCPHHSRTMKENGTRP